VIWIGGGLVFLAGYPLIWWGVGLFTGSYHPLKDVLGLGNVKSGQQTILGFPGPNAGGTPKSQGTSQAPGTTTAAGRG
jgi:hypothetical protein